MSVAQLHQRNPFKFSDEIPELDQDTSERVLDEQEQEEIIEKLEQENAKIARSYALLGTVAVGFSSIIQILSIIGIVGPGGLTVKLFGLLHLMLHFHAALVLQNQTEIAIGEKRHPVPPLLPAQLAVGLYPLVSYPGSETVNWAFVAGPVVVTLVAWMSFSAISDGKASISQLEGLKYTAKGA